MHLHLDDALATLSDRMLYLGSMADEFIARSVKALTERDSAAARRLIAEDEAVDQVELEVDRMCMDILSRHHPIASDLRFVTTAMKVAPELERLADLACSVCERVLDLNEEPELAAMVDLPQMARRARAMLASVTDAMVRRDGMAARATLRMDDELDACMERTFSALLTVMTTDPAAVPRALRLLMVAKNFERMGDHCTNIAEMVVYVAEGQVIRHGGRQTQKGTE